MISALRDLSGTVTLYPEKSSLVMRYSDCESGAVMYATSACTISPTFVVGGLSDVEAASAFDFPKPHPSYYESLRRDQCLPVLGRIAPLAQSVFSWLATRDMIVTCGDDAPFLFSLGFLRVCHSTRRLVEFLQLRLS